MKITTPLSPNNLNSCNIQNISSENNSNSNHNENNSNYNENNSNHNENVVSNENNLNESESDYDEMPDLIDEEEERNKTNFEKYTDLYNKLFNINFQHNPNISNLNNIINYVDKMDEIYGRIERETKNEENKKQDDEKYSSLEKNDNETCHKLDESSDDNPEEPQEDSDEDQDEDSEEPQEDSTEDSEEPQEDSDEDSDEDSAEDSEEPQEDSEEEKTIYSLNIDDITVACSKSFSALNSKMDDIIREYTVKYMENNNIYVSNNSVGNCNVSIIPKNSVWPIEKNIGNFSIKKIRVY